jgi:hypothetical protein
MFERYTHAARRLIFLARKQADEAGSAFIEPQHFILPLLGEENSLLRRMLSPQEIAAIRNEPAPAEDSDLTASLATSSRDLPLSHASKRVLAYTAEEAEQMRARTIDSWHFSIGLLREPSEASRLLEKYGVTRERILREIGLDKTHLAQPHPAARERLNALVATLPEGALEQAFRMLERMQTWPPSPRQIPARIEEIQRQMQERLRASVRPGKGVMGGSGGGWSLDAGGKLRSGSYSASRIEEGERVTETHRFFEGHEITTIERVRIDEERGKLHWKQAIRGPKKAHQYKIDFDLG